MRRRAPSVWRLQRLLIEAARTAFLGIWTGASLAEVAYRLFDPPRQRRYQLLDTAKPP